MPAGMLAAQPRVKCSAHPLASCPHPALALPCWCRWSCRRCQVRLARQGAAAEALAYPWPRQRVPREPPLAAAAAAAPQQ